MPLLQNTFKKMDFFPIILIDNLSLKIPAAT